MQAFDHFADPRRAIDRSVAVDGAAMVRREAGHRRAPILALTWAVRPWTIAR
ncbi:hypothetical protein [Methylobacterium nigriterrae]|uniref:hypothetical protein n=1 Tax=Methylobacterium nigriterrae TaxID=3127512 RepID=UPI003013C2CE